ncbi:succinylglutamic semialdehyde dehydrogenase [Sphingobium boeckii]|uniref:Succinylglutamic semialdehyde dehydrogenase n=1 Tax=Sphingobium boeckii TaxID=1082345 RepID=A0A7W9AFC1_9SPHN|nr:succinylglutamic semialdehyde dehydrogenase [Sphingobium boeckii]
MTQFQSIDPATGEAIWEGAEASPRECAAAIAGARAAFPGWADTPLDERIAIARRFAAVLKEETEAFAEAIARETGKPLWETRTEIAAMIGKVEISIQAQAERAGARDAAMPFGQATLRHRPHGVMAVLGPYNFPGHLPNGHIVPALLAGNCVVFKPSELTPLTGERMAAAWSKAGLPDDVLTLVQGGRATGAALVEGEIDGLLFTGSAAAGAYFRRAFAERPDVILALELGGNNPLIAWDSPAQAASVAILSAFITTGQRCSCARRMIVPTGRIGDQIVEAIAATATKLRIGAWDDEAEPFMGPLIGSAAADSAERSVRALEAMGARTILPFTRLERGPAFVSPAMLDVTGIAAPDEEIFAPVIQINRVERFDQAIAAANATRFGLSAGLVSGDSDLWDLFSRRIRAGVVNWNRPTTGAASNMPFGGTGDSGNHRPSAYYAADYCAYPMASFEAAQLADLSSDYEKRLI